MYDADSIIQQDNLQDNLVDNERVKKEIENTASHKKQTDNFITEIKPQKERIEWIVVLRAFACMAVVMIHVIGDYYSNFQYDNTNQYEIVRAFINQVLLQPFIRYAVPVFIMISGCLLLNPQRNVTINKLVKYIIRTIILLVLLLLFSSLMFNLKKEIFYDMPSFIKWIKYSIKMFVSCLIIDLNTFALAWYPPMLIGLYLLTPILRIFTKHAKPETVSFVLITLFICSCVIPTVNVYFNLNIINFSEVSSVVFLYLIGYYIVHTNLIKNTYIYLGGIIGFICYFIASYFGVSHQLDMFMILESMMIFKLFSSSKIKIKNNKIINCISKYSLGIFLTHCFWMKFFAKINIYFTIFPIFIGEFLYWAYILIISLVTSMILYRLPLIKKLFK